MDDFDTEDMDGYKTMMIKEIRCQLASLFL